MPLTINAAARQLGISTNAVRCRIRRGSLKATKRGSRVFVHLDQGDQGPTTETLQAKVRELADLLERERQEKERLYTLLEREQVLKQGLQAHLDRLTETLALPSPAGEGRGELSPLVARLRKRRRSA